MSISTVLTILSVVNALLSVAKDAPAVIAEAKSLLAKVAPHIDAANAQCRAQFDALQSQLAALG